MKIYLDTANIKEIEEGASLGLIDGVTTNPSLVAKEGRSFKEVLLEICHLVDGPISAEVVGTESEAMVKEGRELAKIHNNIVVKVPLIMEGLRATKMLAAEGIRVNVTLCFSLRKPCSPPRPEPGASLRLSVDWMTSARTAWN